MRLSDAWRCSHEAVLRPLTYGARVSVPAEPVLHDGDVALRRDEARADDAVSFVGRYAAPIHLLYLDADGTNGRGKGVYLDILQAGYDRIPAGSLVLAHNSVNCADRLSEYLAFVRDPAHFRASVNVILDPEGLEVSVK